MKPSQRHLFALACSAALAATVANAAASQAPTATAALDAALASLCPGVHLVENAVRRADLDGDGIADTAALVECPAEPDRRLAVFKGSADGTLRPLSQSAAWPVDPYRWDGVAYDGSKVR